MTQEHEKIKYRNIFINHFITSLVLMSSPFYLHLGFNDFFYFDSFLYHIFFCIFSYTTSLIIFQYKLYEIIKPKITSYDKTFISIMSIGYISLISSYFFPPSTQATLFIMFLAILILLIGGIACSSVVDNENNWS